MDQPRIVPQTEWLAARKKLLAREKQLTHLHDQVNAERRSLPWVKVEKDYVFEGPDGKQTLADLFEGRSQLIVYHFMWRFDIDTACPSCSFLADHMDGANWHLPHHDVTLIAISRGPFAKLAAYKQRMGWQFKMVSSHGSDFNYDYGVSFTKAELAKGKVYYNYGMTEGYDELPGLSVFTKDAAGQVFHTYSTYARGGDIFLGAHNFLDLTPKGRNETTIMDWVRRHDEYEATKPSATCCHPG